MELRFVKTLHGMPEPADVFQPHMPDVALLSNMDAFFAAVREMIKTGHPQYQPQSDQRWIAVVPPDREIHLIPCAHPNSLSLEHVKEIHNLLPSHHPLMITAVSYTYRKAFIQDTEKTKCIPFLGYLRSWGYVGHNVLVFEGHSSAFASAVRKSDVLLVDSGMEPFLSQDWKDIAFSIMSPNPRKLIHNRKTYSLDQVHKTGV